jgi:hypothetical protein
MKNVARVLGLVLVLCAATTNVQAQSLKQGTWDGKAAGPDGHEIAVTFEVKSTGDSLSISLLVPEGPKVPFSMVRFEEGKLLYQLELGVTINCVLSPLDGGAFGGPCTDAEGGTGSMTMTPPRT